MSPFSSSVQVQVRAEVPLPLWLQDGSLAAASIATFANLPDGREHIALLMGAWQDAAVPLVRVHSECLTGDAFSSARCDCGPQLDQALTVTADSGGIVIYLRQEGRGIGLYNKIDAYALQDQGLNTYEANVALNQPPDQRDYTIAALMLRALGVTGCELLTNNPEKRRQLTEAGVAVLLQRPTDVFQTPLNRRYLEAKVAHGGHLMGLARTP